MVSDMSHNGSNNLGVPEDKWQYVWVNFIWPYKLLYPQKSDDYCETDCGVQEVRDMVQSSHKLVALPHFGKIAFFKYLKDSQAEEGFTFIPHIFQGVIWNHG